MFWGLIMEPNKRYSQTVKKPFHISMAAQDVSSSDKTPSQVLCCYEGRNYLLCTLQYPNVIQCQLDLNFAVGTEVAFATNGKGHIHLTGYIHEDEDEDSLTLDQLAEEEESEDEQVVEKKTKKSKKKHQDSSPEVPVKKAKLVNGSASEDVEEEESDDPDFEESEEEGSDEGEEEEDEDTDSDQDVVEEEEEDQSEAKPIQQVKSKKKQQEATPPKPKKQTLKMGVIVEDLVEGSGPQAKTGRFVTVHYEGRLQKTNKLFDSTNKGPGFKFCLGRGEVIKGWDIGVAGMKVGGKRRITCPPQAAYGAQGSLPAIPPNSTLVFTVTLNKIK